MLLCGLAAIAQNKQTCKDGFIITGKDSVPIHVYLERLNGIKNDTVRLKMKENLYNLLKKQ